MNFCFIKRLILFLLLVTIIEMNVGHAHAQNTTAAGGTVSVNTDYPSNVAVGSSFPLTLTISYSVATNYQPSSMYIQIESVAQLKLVGTPTSAPPCVGMGDGYCSFELTKRSDVVTVNFLMQAPSNVTPSWILSVVVDLDLYQPPTQNVMSISQATANVVVAVGSSQVVTTMVEPEAPITTTIVEPTTTTIVGPPIPTGSGAPIGGDQLPYLIIIAILVLGLIVAIGKARAKSKS